MKSLFDENERYTQDALKLDAETYNALEPIFQRWFNLGFSRREIGAMMMGSVNEIMLQSLFENSPREPLET